MAIKKKLRIAVTGLSGVIGGVLYKKLSSEMQIIDLYHNNRLKGVKQSKYHKQLDLLKPNSIEKILESIKPDVIIHLAAVTHIDECEKDKVNGVKGRVWRTNVVATDKIAKFCARTKTQLIFLSTECVFDGKNGPFDEKHKKNPINWYGLTKSEAEEKVMQSGAPAAILRSVVAYHKNDNGKSIYGKMLNELKLSGGINTVGDQFFAPTYTYDIVRAIKTIIKQNLNGVYHIAPHVKISPYDFAVLVAKKNKFNSDVVKKVSLRKYYDANRAILRLKNSCLDATESFKILKFEARAPEEIL